MDTNLHGCGFTVQALRSGGWASFLQEDDTGQRNGAAALRQLLRVGSVVGDQVMSFELIQCPTARREIQRHGFLAFEGGESFAPKLYLLSVSDPHLARRWIEFLAQTERENL